MAMDPALMAQRITDDPWCPIRDRVHATDVLHLLTHGRSVTASDAWQLRVIHGQRQREALALARLYGVVS